MAIGQCQAEGGGAARRSWCWTTLCSVCNSVVSASRTASWRWPWVAVSWLGWWSCPHRSHFTPSSSLFSIRSVLAAHHCIPVWFRSVPDDLPLCLLVPFSLE